MFPESEVLPGEEVDPDDNIDFPVTAIPCKTLDTPNGLRLVSDCRLWKTYVDMVTLTYYISLFVTATLNKN